WLEETGLNCIGLKKSLCHVKSFNGVALDHVQCRLVDNTEFINHMTVKLS
ncbi:21696_t:CDS:1, partial [Gigaspora rosea]